MISKEVSLSDKDFCRVKTSWQFVILLLNVPIIYQETSLLFIGKSYPLFIVIFIKWETITYLSSDWIIKKNTV